jgi:hypothetical protein
MIKKISKKEKNNIFFIQLFISEPVGIYLLVIKIDNYYT